MVRKFTLLILMMVGSSLANAANYELTYKAQSGFVQLGSSQLTINVGSGNYQLSMHRKLSVPGMLKDHTIASVQGNIKSEYLYPKNFRQTRTGKELTRETKISWKDKHPSVSLNPPLETRAETALDISTAYNSIDPISSIYKVMHDINEGRGCSAKFISFDGVSTIDTTVLALPEKRISTKFYRGSAVGCQLVMIGRSGLVMGGSNAESATKTNIWFAKPDAIQEYIPVIIEATIGSKKFSMLLENVNMY